MVNQLRTKWFLRIHKIFFIESTANFTSDCLTSQPVAPPTPCMEISLRNGTKPHRQLSISCVLGCFKNKSNESNVDVHCTCNIVNFNIIVKILNIYTMLSCTHLILLSSIYPFTQCLSLLVTIICYPYINV